MRGLSSNTDCNPAKALEVEALSDQVTTAVEESTSVRGLEIKHGFLSILLKTKFAESWGLLCQTR
jgi:hypothetical protein